MKSLILNKHFFRLPLSAFLLFCFLLFTLHPCFGQVEKLPPPQSLQKESPGKKNRPMFTTGGGLGFQFGFNNTIYLAPQFGVYATPWLVVLANAQYSYMWQKNFYNAHLWGIGAALEPIIIKKIVAHIGYEFSQINFRWLDGSSQWLTIFTM